MQSIEILYTEGNRNVNKNVNKHLIKVINRLLFKQKVSQLIFIGQTWSFK